MLAAVPLQGAQVIRVTEPGAQPLKDLPVMPGIVGADLSVQMRFQIGNNAVVIQQRIVDIEKENDFPPSAWGLGSFSFNSFHGRLILRKRFGPEPAAAAEGICVIAQPRAEWKFF